MQLTPDQATEILRQIHSNQWRWLGIKRFVPEAYPDLAHRYDAFEKHHAEETGKLIEII